MALLFIGLAVPRATAQSPSPSSGGDVAKTHFDQGVKHYTVGRFVEAIAEFQQAYDAEPAPILLFNIAQSYRQLGSMDRALFFYRRYLEQAPPDASNRPEVEQRMKDLTHSIERANTVRKTPPTAVARPAVGGSPTVVPATEVNVATAVEPPKTPAATPPVTTTAVSPERPTATPFITRWAALAYVAPSFPFASATGDAIKIPAQISLRLGGAYAFPLPSARLTVGLDGVLGFIPYAYDRDKSAISTLPGLLATAAYLYNLTPRISVGGGVGAGVVWWGGLRGNSTLTQNIETISGTFAMPTVEANLRITLAVRSDLLLISSPGIIYSKPAGGLEKAISAVSRFDINLGAEYRF